METKDIITAAGLTLTFAVGVWNLVLNYRTARQTRFINTITTERVKWMHEVKVNVSDLCGSVHSWMLMYAQQQTPNKDAEELLKKIDRLRYQIPLILNPEKPAEKTVEDAVSAIPRITNNADVTQLQDALNDLTEKTRKLLREEWKIVKREVLTGKLDVKTK
ncbi:MAG: hypothetical protein ACK4UN_15675 [Limisphaerales bacterium]